MRERLDFIDKFKILKTEIGGKDKNLICVQKFT